jgi:hypothetical protein
VRSRLALCLVVSSLAVVAVGTAAYAASASTKGASCGGKSGYRYAGHQSTRTGHGVRAIITAVRQPTTAAGHVAGWVGVGGPGQGPNGENEWLQVGFASFAGTPNALYAEVTRPGADPEFILLERLVPIGSPRHVAVLEMSKRPGTWRVWVEGDPVTEPISLPGSADRWAPIATAESWLDGNGSCNAFSFRFEQVGVAQGRGGSWRPFVPGYRFLDEGLRLRPLTPTPGARTLTATGPEPYAFLASTAS